jgi:hypothetical protein
VPENLRFDEEQERVDAQEYNDIQEDDFVPVTPQDIILGRNYLQSLPSYDKWKYLVIVDNYYGSFESIEMLDSLGIFGIGCVRNNHDNEIKLKVITGLRKGEIHNLYHTVNKIGLLFQLIDWSLPSSHHLHSKQGCE